MATQTSSLIGVSLTNTDSTGQFAMGTRATGGGALGGGSDWEYVYATATISTGKFVYIAPNGTANLLTTGNIAASTAGLKLGVAQFLMSAGEYGFVAMNGGPLYLACTGTVPPTVQVGLAANAGVLQTSLAVAVGNTMAGIFVTTSASTATLSVTQGIITYPRPITGTVTPAA